MSKLPLWRDIFSSHLPVNLQEMYPTPIEQDGNPAPLGIAEREMTDAQMKKREEIVKSMKDEKDDFESRYPGRGKEVMYATATKMAMEEDALSEGSLEEVSLDLAKRARDKAEYFVDMDYDDMRDRPYGYSEKQRSKFQRYIDRKKASETFTVMAINDANPAWKQGGYNYKPNTKVIDQHVNIERNEIVTAAKMLRQKHPKATISVENKGGKIMKVFKPGQVIKEANGDTDYETYFRGILKKHGYDSPADIPDDKKDDFFNAVDKGYNATNESLQLDEKNVPTNPELWSRAKAAAKRKFDVYPSAYANGWAAKWYKKRGGGWRTESKEAYNLSDPEQREFGTNSLATIYKSSTPGELRESDDQEMAVAQLHSIASKSIKVRDMLKDVMIDDIPAWIQDKLSVSDHSMAAILDYYTHYENENTDDPHPQIAQPHDQKCACTVCKMMRAAASETPIAESSSSVVEASKDPMVPLRMQAAMVIAKSLGSVKGSGQTADFRVSGGTPESIVNQAVRVWLSGSHTNEGWALGAKMLKLAKSMGIKWDENLLKGKLGPITIKKLGLAETDAETVALRNKHKQQATALKLQQAREKMSLKQRKLQQQAQKAKP